MSGGDLFWAGMAALGVLAAVVLALPTLAMLWTLMSVEDSRR